MMHGGASVVKVTQMWPAAPPRTGKKGIPGSFRMTLAGAAPAICLWNQQWQDRSHNKTSKTDQNCQSVRSIFKIH